MTDLERELLRSLMQVDSDLQELRQSADRWDMERADLKAHIDELKLNFDRITGERCALLSDIERLKLDRDAAIRHVESLEAVIQSGTRPSCSTGHTYSKTTGICLWCGAKSK